MSNPFAEGGDGDRTVIRPQPAANPFDEGDRTVIRQQPAGNPFDEGDGDRTVIRPTPGGTRAARPAVRPATPAPSHPTPPAPAQPAPARTAPPRPAPAQLRPPPTPAAPSASDTRMRRMVAPAPLPADAEPATGQAPGADLAAIASAHADPLLAAATPLLLLLGRLRAATPPDPGDVRARTLREVRAFERQARGAGVPMEQVRPVHLALCASLDDAALNTPWGRASGWEAAPLTRTLHQESRGGQAFLDQAEALVHDPGANPVGVEVAYLCLALGFLGPLRDAPGGPQRAEALRQELHALFRTRQPQGGAAQDVLAPHVAGVAAPYRPQRTRFPVWVAVSIALAVAAGVFAWTLIGLNGRSDEVGARMLAAPPATMPGLVRSPLVQPPPAPPPAPEPTLAERLRDALQADVEAKRLLVRETSSGAVVQLGSRGLFAPGGATLLPAAAPLLERVAQGVKDALREAQDAPAQPPEQKPQPPVRVLGYTDNQPTRTVRFPSNFQLSAAQAAAVRGVLAKALGDSPRIPSEGRADADPVAPNTSPDGREQNRRVEVVVQRPADR